MEMYLKSSKMFVMSETLKISRATEWIFSQFVWEKRRTATQIAETSFFHIITFLLYFIPILHCYADTEIFAGCPNFIWSNFASSISRAEICWPYLCILVNTQTFYSRTYFWMKYLMFCVKIKSKNFESK